MEVFENLDINDLENKFWKVITDFPDYSISNIGRVKSFKKCRNKNIKILKQYKYSNYLGVSLCKNGKQKTKFIHTLVFETFSGYKLKDDECVHHIDEDRYNNIFENLIKMNKSEHHSFHNKGKVFTKEHKNKISKTRKEKFKNGEFKILNGENNPMFGKHHSEETKKKISENNLKNLSNQKIIDIENDIGKTNLTQLELSHKYNVSQSTISKIKNRNIKYENK